MKKPEFNCYGIVNKNNEIVTEKAAFSGIQMIAKETADMLNRSQHESDMESAPYQPVEIFVRKIK